MIEVLKAETNKLTPQFLEWFRGLDPSPFERELKESRLKFLVEKAAEQEIIPFYWATVRYDGKLFRVNGQHSSEMLAGLASLDPSWVAFYVEFNAKTKEDLGKIYRQFDARQSGRSPLDICNAYRGLEADLKPVSAKTVKLATEGSYWHDQYIVGTNRNVRGDDRYERIINNEEDHPFLLLCGSVYSVKTPELEQVPVAASIYGSFRMNESDCRHFWTDVAKGGVGTESDDPAGVLDEWLKDALDKNSRRSLKLRPANYWNACIFAWNAFRQGKGITSIPATAKGYGIDKGLHEVL